MIYEQWHIQWLAKSWGMILSHKNKNQHSINKLIGERNKVEPEKRRAVGKATKQRKFIFT